MLEAGGDQPVSAYSRPQQVPPRTQKMEGEPVAHSLHLQFKDSRWDPLQGQVPSAAPSLLH